VGSIDPLFNRSGFSNWGWCIDIWAPGTDIESAQGKPYNVTSGNAFPLNATTLKSGTSMACPHVSGAAAILLSADPDMKPAKILESLLAKASVNYIRDLSPFGEPNLLLYVGADGPQQEKPAPDQNLWPERDYFQICYNAGQQGPLYPPYHDCRCTFRADRNDNETIATTCYETENMTKGCPISEALYGIRPSLNLYYYDARCETCKCLTAAEVHAKLKAIPTNWWLISGVVELLVILFLALVLFRRRAQNETPAGARSFIQTTSLENTEL